MPIAIGYSSRKVERICLEARVARKELPQQVAKLLPQRLLELAAFDNLGQVPPGAPLHFHPLRENWRGHYGVSVGPRYRIVFLPAGAFTSLEDGTPDLGTVVEIEIVVVEDYHDG
jgi:proteic killer suppression protein